MNRSERIYRLHAILNTGRPVALKRMQSELEVSRATIVRDLAYLRDFMGAPIIYDREQNGHYYDPEAPSYELPGFWFNASELYALLATEQLLEQVQPGFLGTRLGPLKTRIRNLLSESGQPAEVVSTRIHLQPIAVRAVDEGLFSQVSEAVLVGRQLKIEYHGRDRGETTRRRIHPLRLIHYRDNWYLAAWCEQVEDLRNFSLDRIGQVQMLEAPVRPVVDQVLDHHLGAAFGIFAGESKAWAVLRFTSDRARWVADELWHPDQIARFDGDEYELQVPYSDPRELLMDILKYGPDVEVVAPTDLRELVRERLRTAVSRYSKG